MAFGDIFLPDMGIQIDALHVVVPFSGYVGITQQAVVQSEFADKQVGVNFKGEATGPAFASGVLETPVMSTDLFIRNLGLNEGCLLYTSRCV